jgi:hypothetical protein
MSLEVVDLEQYARLDASLGLEMHIHRAVLIRARSP